MPSPFPGMDPYIEQPEIWTDFHNNLASEIQANLNEVLMPDYFAELEPYVTYETLQIGSIKATYPDITVAQPYPAQDKASSSARLQQAATTLTIDPAPVLSEVDAEVPIRLYHVQVRSIVHEQLVTVIEILSPVNKRVRHEAYDHYLQKRREILRSGAVHLLEIDLLRGGTRPPLLKPVPEASYYVSLARIDNRPQVEVWPIQLTDKLPTLPVPLIAPDPDVPLDLQSIVNSVYRRAAYSIRVDYSQPVPPPKLAENESEWVEERLRAFADN